MGCMKSVMIKVLTFSLIMTSISFSSSAGGKGEKFFLKKKNKELFPKALWMEGLGGSNNVGLMLGANFGIQRSEWIQHIVKISHSTEINILSSSPNENATEMSYMMGVSHTTKLTLAFIRAGLGLQLSKFQTSTEEECEEFGNCRLDASVMPGIPMEAGVALGKYLGVGVKLTAFVSRRTTGGFAFLVPLGVFN